MGRVATGRDDARPGRSRRPPRGRPPSRRSGREPRRARSSPKRSGAAGGPDRDICRRALGPSDGWPGWAGRRRLAFMRLALPRVRAREPCRRPLAIALVLAAASTAAASEFPAGKQGYHSYTEMAAEVAAVAAAHPDIVSRFSIGKSYQGRDLWAVKISDNVNVDEPEPEVMFDGGHHADEHMCDRDDAPHPPLARRRLRRRPADHHDRRLARDLDRVHGQPRRRRIRHRRRQVPLLAQEPPADARHQLDRHGPQPQLRLPLGRRRPNEREPGEHHLSRPVRRSRRRRIARCATSWPAASSAVGSRSGRR